MEMVGYVTARGDWELAPYHTVDTVASRAWLWLEDNVENWFVVQVSTDI